MNPLEKELDYPFGIALPEAGATIEVAPGVRWIRMGLPFALNHINLWLLQDEITGPDGSRIPGWTVVDCCITRDEAKAQWEQLFATQLGGLPILRVIVTHMHPDHIGLAWWLCDFWSAPLWISATDYHTALLATQRTIGFGGASAARFFATHGQDDPAVLDAVAARTGYYPGMVPAVPASYHRMMDGMELRIGGRAWHCIAGYGHAPEHIALYSPELGVLIGGDMMLPGISTNVSVYDVEPESNPLALFLASIDRFRPLAEHTMVLPSHGRPFRGLHRRIEQLHAHHRARLAEVLAACRERPRHAADILPVMFRRPLDLHQTTFAMGEALAHLHALWFDGQLERERGSDGTLRFAAA